MEGPPRDPTRDTGQDGQRRPTTALQFNMLMRLEAFSLDTCNAGTSSVSSGQNESRAGMQRPRSKRSCDCKPCSS